LKNNLKGPIFITLVSLLVGLVAIGSVFALVLVNPKSEDVHCEQSGTTHRISINNNTVSPSITYAQKCDNVVIINGDKEIRKIGFGDHDNHQAFAGVEEKMLESGQSFTLVLNQTGRADFHDHYNYDVEGTIVVSN
jgi:hypothetical protein